MQDFITGAYVGKQSVIRDLVTGTEYPYKTGADGVNSTEEQLEAITTRAEAEQAAITAQRTLVAAMRASGALAKSVDDLDGIRAAYAIYSA